MKRNLVKMIALCMLLVLGMVSLCGCRKKTPEPPYVALQDLTGQDAVQEIIGDYDANAPVELIYTEDFNEIGRTNDAEVIQQTWNDLVEMKASSSGCMIDFAQMPLCRDFVFVLADGSEVKFRFEDSFYVEGDYFELESGDSLKTVASYVANNIK